MRQSPCEIGAQSHSWQGQALMYVAIVLLPLLGAVVAGIISLVGARNRFPGEEPPPPPPCRRAAR